MRRTIFPFGEMGERSGSERKQRRTAQSFCVPKKDIATQGYVPLAESLQGGRARGDRARKPSEIPADLAKLEENSARDERAGEDAVNASPSPQRAD